MRGMTWDYDGELDDDSKPCGYGEATCIRKDEFITGYFYNGFPNGVCQHKFRQVQTHAESLWVGEFKDGYKFGKVTYTTKR